MVEQVIRLAGDADAVGADTAMCAAYSGACVHVSASRMWAGGIPLASTHLPKETLVRAPTLLAATVLAGTILLGGAGQALAYDSDDMSNAGVGSNSPATSDFGQGASGSDQGPSDFGQDASGLGQGASGLGQGASGMDQDASGFDQDASGFDRAIGH